MKKEEYRCCRHHSQGRNWVKVVLAFSDMRSSCTLSLYLTYYAACFQPTSTFTKAKAMLEINGQTQGDFLPRFHTTPQGALLRYLIYNDTTESHVSW